MLYLTTISWVHLSDLGRDEFSSGMQDRSCWSRGFSDRPLIAKVNYEETSSAKLGQQGALYEVAGESDIDTVANRE